MNGSSCIACTNISLSLRTACLNCGGPTFFHNNYTCELATVITNINSTSGACPTYYTLSVDVITNQTTSCVCSIAAGYYTNASSCKSCTTEGIAGVSSENCIACSLSFNFYKSAKECIYCPNAQYSTGVASLSGCSCQTNYYWSTLKSRCECDWL